MGSASRCGIDLLEALQGDRAEALGGLRVAELAEITGRHRSLVSRIAEDLMQLGLLDRDPATRRFSLSWRLYAQAARIGAERFRRRSPSHLRRLVAVAAESAYAVMRAGAEALTISEAASEQAVVVASRVGRAWPVARSDAGPALLAALTDDEIRDLLGDELPTPGAARAPGSVSELLLLVDEVRQTGVSILDEQTEEGVASAAAPVIDHRGRTAGAIVVSGPAHRVRPRLDDIAPAVVAAARDLSSDLGTPADA